VQPYPDAGLLPIPQPAPARDAAPAAQLLGEQPPGASRPQYEDDPTKNRSVRNPRTTTFQFGRFLGQQGLDGFPKVVGDEE